MVVNNKRFNRIPNTDLFEDVLTGEEIRFTNTQRILRLLNSLNDDNDKLSEECYECTVNNRLLKQKLEAYFKVLEKHQIHTAEKLDKCLTNERVW